MMTEGNPTPAEIQKAFEGFMMNPPLPANGKFMSTHRIHEIISSSTFGGENSQENTNTDEIQNAREQELAMMRLSELMNEFDQLMQTLLQKPELLKLFQSLWFQCVAEDFTDTENATHELRAEDVKLHNRLFLRNLKRFPPITKSKDILKFFREFEAEMHKRGITSNKRKEEQERGHIMYGIRILDNIQPVIYRCHILDLVIQNNTRLSVLEEELDFDTVSRKLLTLEFEEVLKQCKNHEDLVIRETDKVEFSYKRRVLDASGFRNEADVEEICKILFRGLFSKDPEKFKFFIEYLLHKIRIALEEKKKNSVPKKDEVETEIISETRGNIGGIAASDSGSPKTPLPSDLDQDGSNRVTKGYGFGFIQPEWLKNKEVAEANSLRPEDQQRIVDFLQSHLTIEQKEDLPDLLLEPELMTEFTGELLIACTKDFNDHHPTGYFMWNDLKKAVGSALISMAKKVEASKKLPNELNAHEKAWVRKLVLESDLFPGDLEATRVLLKTIDDTKKVLMQAHLIETNFGDLFRDVAGRLNEKVHQGEQKRRSEQVQETVLEVIREVVANEDSFEKILVEEVPPQPLPDLLISLKDLEKMAGEKIPEFLLEDAFWKKIRVSALAPESSRDNDAVHPTLNETTSSSSLEKHPLEKKKLAPADEHEFSATYDKPSLVGSEEDPQKTSKVIDKDVQLEDNERSGSILVNVTKILPDIDDVMSSDLKNPSSEDVPPLSSEKQPEPAEELPPEPSDLETLPEPGPLSADALNQLLQTSRDEVVYSSRFSLHLRLKTKVNLFLQQKPEFIAELASLEAKDQIPFIEGLEEYVLELNASVPAEIQLTNSDVENTVEVCVRDRFEKSSEKLKNHQKTFDRFALLLPLLSPDERADAEKNLTWLQELHMEMAASKEIHDEHTSFLLALSEFFSPKAEGKFPLLSIRMMSTVLSHLRFVSDQGKKRNHHNGKNVMKKNGEKKKEYGNLIGDLLKKISHIDDPSDPLSIARSRLDGSMEVLSVMSHESEDRYKLLEDQKLTVSSSEEISRIDAEMSALSQHMSLLQQKRIQLIQGINDLVNRLQ